MFGAVSAQARLGSARPGYPACLGRAPLPAVSFSPAQACSLTSRTPLPPCTWAVLCLSPPLPSLASRPWGSNRSSRGQNTISFNKLNLLRLLITSGVGSDQRGGYSPGGPCGGGREEEIHVEGVESLAGPGDPSHSNRNSGQVSILLDKNREEGAYPPLPLAQLSTPLPQERAGVCNTEMWWGVRAEIGG